MTKEEIISDIMTRSVDNIVDKDNLKKRLNGNEKLTIKLGIDPTSKNIHIGRGVVLLKLKRFQDLGHKIVLIIGDFTGVVGDTSDKTAERPMIDRKVIEENMKNYVEQAGKILDMSNVEVRYNSEWLMKLNFWQVSEIADKFSVSDFISRSNIKDRLDKGTRVSLRETLYPLMQGYDSVAIKADVELGGSDQWFNILAGRTLQEAYGQVKQDILTTKLIEGLDGRKMSSSWGNTVNFLDEPRDMFGKIMTLEDRLVGDDFEDCTLLPIAEVNKYREILKDTKTNPRDIKEILAFEITKLYNGEDKATEAKNYFVSVIRNKEKPEVIEERIVKSEGIVDILVEVGFAESKSDSRRLVLEGGVKVNDEVVKDPSFKVIKGSLIQKGKRFFVKIV